METQERIQRTITNFDQAYNVGIWVENYLRRCKSEKLGDPLSNFYNLYRPRLLTQTYDAREYGWGYLSGLLHMGTQRNLANISRETALSSQNVQHFISNLPWSSRALIEAIQDTIILLLHLQLDLRGFSCPAG